MEFYYKLVNQQLSPQSYSKFEKFSSDQSQDNTLKIDGDTLNLICT